MIDYLFGNVKYHKEKNNVSYAEFYDSNGEMIACYSNGGWTFYGTKEENARESEVWMIYNQAWNTAAKASKCDGTITDVEDAPNTVNMSV